MRKNRYKKAGVLMIFSLFVLGMTIPSINSISGEIITAPLDTDEWWSPHWDYRKMITIDHTLVNSTLTNFPLLISLTDSDISSEAQNDADDILFTDQSPNKLDHEVEYFNCATDELVCWVKIPSLSSTEDTIIYLYYGNDECGDQQNVEGVWINNFMMVHHLKETTGTHYDSTSNNNDGIAYGGLNQNADGILDGCDGFDGDDDYIDCGNDDSVDVTTITASGWVKPTLIGDSWQRLVAKETSSNGANGYGVYVHTDGTIYWALDGIASQSTASITSDTWSYIVCTADGADEKIFINGVLADNFTNGYTAGSSTVSLYIGKSPSLTDRQFDGYIDEVRISDVARSADWILTEYNNQNEPSSFYSVGIEEEKEPNDSPSITNPDPFDGAEDVYIELDELSVTIKDTDGDLFDWTIETSPDIGNASGTNEGNGTKTCVVSNLDYETTYTWTVTAIDPEGSDETTTEIFTFTTEIYNDPPNTPTKPYGPIILNVGEEGEFCTTATDPNDDDLQYRFDWGDGTITDWSSPIPSGDEYCDTSIWGIPGEYVVKSQARDEHGEYSEWSSPLYVDIIGENEPPNTPNKPIGPVQLIAGEVGEYCTNAYDPDEDKVQYMFDWGDGNFSEWTELVDSGKTGCLEYSWEVPGIYNVKTLARDEKTAESEQWSEELVVTIVDDGEDLGCIGRLTWTDIGPGETVEGSFRIENVGNPNSKLDWEIVEWPEWGCWYIEPLQGEDLKPEDASVVVEVTLVCPPENMSDSESNGLKEHLATIYTGQIKIINLENCDDCGIVDVELTIPRTRNTPDSMFLRILERLSNVNPMFEHILSIIKSMFLVS